MRDNVGGKQTRRPREPIEPPVRRVVTTQKQLMGPTRSRRGRTIT